MSSNQLATYSKEISVIFTSKLVNGISSDWGTKKIKNGVHVTFQVWYNRRSINYKTEMVWTEILFNHKLDCCRSLHQNLPNTTNALKESRHKRTYSYSEQHLILKCTPHIDQFKEITFQNVWLNKEKLENLGSFITALPQSLQSPKRIPLKNLFNGIFSVSEHATISFIVIKVYQRLI